MKKHLRTSVAAFSVLGLALVGCEADDNGTEDLGLEEPADDTLEEDTTVDGGTTEDTAGEETTADG